MNHLSNNPTPSPDSTEADHQNRKLLRKKALEEFANLTRGQRANVRRQIEEKLALSFVQIFDTASGALIHVEARMRTVKAEDLAQLAALTQLDQQTVPKEVPKWTSENQHCRRM